MYMYSMIYKSFENTVHCIEIVFLVLSIKRILKSHCSGLLIHLQPIIYNYCTITEESLQVFRGQQQPVLNCTAARMHYYRYAVHINVRIYCVGRCFCILEFCKFLLNMQVIIVQKKGGLQDAAQENVNDTENIINKASLAHNFCWILKNA